MRQRIRVKERLPVWGLRLIFGMILMTFSELVMWQNPVAHTLIDWPVLLVLYVALAAIMMDLVVRFQARQLTELLLISGIYGMASAAIISHSAFDNYPFGLIIRALGLQTGAGFYGLMLFVTIMRGRPIDWRYIGAAIGIGLLWGIWLHWYPIQQRINWGLVPIATAQLYILPALVLIGLLFFFVAPRFRFLLERQMQLLWWEVIVVGLPLFIALLVGMLQTNAAQESLIPVIPMVILIVIGGCITWALFYQRHGYEPSILAQMIYVAPNTVSFIILAITFLFAGTLVYGLIDGPDSPIGVAVYLLVFVFGTGWLPLTSLLMFWRYYRTRPIYVLDKDETPEGEE